MASWRICRRKRDEGIQAFRHRIRAGCALAGKFKTAFPNGKPEDKKDEKRKTAIRRTRTKSRGKEADDSLKEIQRENTVILVGDADMLFDRVRLQPVQTLFRHRFRPANGNLSLAQNAVEQLTGDSNLINVRSRATQNRPFTRVKAMEAAANEKFQSEIKRLEDSRQRSAAQSQRTAAGEEGQRSALYPLAGTAGRIGEAPHGRSRMRKSGSSRCRKTCAKKSSRSKPN